MAGISRYEKVVLGLTAGFVLFTGGWFLAERQSAQPYEVITAQTQAVESEPSAPEEEKTPDSLLEGEVININTADLYDLQRLPGIGEKRAQAIVEDRERNGPFYSVEELERVPGIGEGILSGLLEYASVGAVEEKG